MKRRTTRPPWDTSETVVSGGERSLLTNVEGAAAKVCHHNPAANGAEEAQCILSKRQIERLRCRQARVLVEVRRVTHEGGATLKRRQLGLQLGSTIVRVHLPCSDSPRPDTRRQSS